MNRPATEPRATDPQARTIRAIQQLARPLVRELNSAFGLESLEGAFWPLTTLRAGRPEDAARAWHAIVREMKRDLRESGVTYGKWYGPLLDHLNAYLEREGWAYDGEARPRRWRPWEETREGKTVTAMRAARQAGAGPTPAAVPTADPQ